MKGIVGPFDLNIYEWLLSDCGASNGPCDWHNFWACILVYSGKEARHVSLLNLPENFNISICCL